MGSSEKWTGLFLIELTHGLEQTDFQVLLQNYIFFAFSFGKREIALSLLDSQALLVVSKITSLRFPPDLPGWTLHQDLRVMHC